jgi:hypothetical protein
MGITGCNYSETRYGHSHLELRVEIVVLGTGEKIMFVQRAREALATMGMQVDVQDTVYTHLYLLIVEKCG